MLLENFKDKLLFALYNFIFSSMIYTLFYSVITEFISFVFCMLVLPKEFDEPVTFKTTIVFFLLLIAFWLIFVLIKFISIPLIYKYSKNQFFKENLNNFLTVDKKEKIRILLEFLLYDIIISLIFLFISVITNKEGNLSSQIVSYIKIQGFCWLYSIGGGFSFFFFFLLWDKLTHRNKTKIAQNSIRAL